MTREEVINGLYDIKNWKCNGDAEMYKTIVEAIQALKQPEPCEDAVSRRKAFEYFVSLWECIGTIMDREEWEDVCKTTANELPSVTPKRKTGKWIKDDFTGIIKCDECGNHSSMDTTGGGQYESNFCPNCGADMNPLPESYKPKEKNDACD